MSPNEQEKFLEAFNVNSKSNLVKSVFEGIEKLEDLE